MDYHARVGRVQFLDGLLDAVTAEGVRTIATIRADLYGLGLLTPDSAR